jgi:D-arabinose 1-dehydrogenase-like Zn-dependent alcohol dehydrogenase
MATTAPIMRRYELVQFGTPLCEEIEPLPAVSGHEVLLRVSACGVCHSDLHLMDGYFDLGHDRKLELSYLNLPRVLGHEIVGEVVAVGLEVHDLPVGARRVVYPWIGCGTCAVCASGQDNLCTQPRTLGVRHDGGFGTHVRVPHPQYLIDFTGLPEHFACTCACSGLTAYSALRKAAPLVGDDPLLILGAGGVGLACLYLAPAVAGVSPTVADIDPAKRQAALDGGAKAVVDPAEPDIAKRLLAMSGGGFAAVIDFVGSAETAELAITVLRRGGKLINVGLHGGAVSVSLPLLTLRSQTLQGSYVGSLLELRELIALLQQVGSYDLPIRSRPLGEVNQVLGDLRAGRVVGRTVVVP